jgi:autotransporter-associated beta strand protein
MKNIIIRFKSGLTGCLVALLGCTVAHAGEPLLGKRVFTFVSVVRVNQIEATRTQNLGQDESSLHTVAAVQAVRDNFSQAFPGGRMTWALSWLALNDQRANYKGIRNQLVQYHQLYGDEITFIPGAYFAPMYNTREQVNQDLHDGLALVSQMVGGGYRPKSVIAGFLAAENQRYLSEQENIHVCQGTIWSQYGIDNGDGDGSISYPYYPSREHYCKPAQGTSDFIDTVCLDGWTCDFLTARRAGFADGFNSRQSLGPIETFMNLGFDAGLKEQLSIMDCHFNDGFARNGFAWTTSIWEVVLGAQTFANLPPLGAEIRRRWPDMQCMTVGDFGEAYRSQFKDNSKLDDRFVERGSGINGSDANLEIRWFMNRDFRLALLHDFTVEGDPEKVIDFTRYDLTAQEPQDLSRNWSLMNVINQKGTRPQDKPVLLAELSKNDQALIRSRLPELAGQFNGLTWDTSAAADDAITDGSGTWATGGGNWNNGTTSAGIGWTPGSLATFTGSTGGTISVDAAGVSQAGLNIAGDGDYTFSGGPISGPGTFNKASGNSTATLSSANTMTGGVSVGGGTLALVGGSMNNLAGPIIVTAGGLTLNNGSLITSNASSYAGTTSGGINLSGNINISGQSVLRRTSSSAYSSLGLNGPINWTQTGGAVTINGQGTDVRNNSTFNVSGGNLAVQGTFMLAGSNVVGSGSTLNVNTAGSVSAGSLYFSHPSLSNGKSTINLGSGGTLAVSSLGGGSGLNHVMNIDGGTLKANAANATWFGASSNLNAYVKAGGVRIDSNGFDVGLGQALLHDPALGQIRDGGLTKAGAGTLTLSGASSYTGGTLIKAGALKMVNAATPGTGPISVDPNAALQYTTSTSSSGGPRIDNDVSGSGPFDVTATSGQSFWWGSFANYTGTLSIAPTGNGATFWMEGSNSGNPGMRVILGATSSSGNLGLYSGTNNVSRTFDIGELSGSATSQIWGQPNTSNLLNLSVGALNTTSIFAGTIKNDWQASQTCIVGLTKVGSGTLIVAGTNIYTGATTITSGKLQLGAGGTAGGLAPASPIANNATLEVKRSNAVVQGADFGTIGGSGGFIQSGSGTTTLNAANTYTGATLVTGGVLNVTGNALPDGGKLLINGGNVNVDGPANETVDALYIGGVRKAAGVWGSSASGATHVDDAHFSGTGTVTVTNGYAAAYADWAAFAGLTPDNDSPGMDPDNDGQNNFQEFALGGNPLSGAMGQPVMGKKAVVNSLPMLVLILPVRNSAVFAGSPDLAATIDGVIYHVQASLDLADWTSKPVNEVPEGDRQALIDAVSPAPSGYANRFFYAPNSQNELKVFLRAKVEQAP